MRTQSLFRLLPTVSVVFLLSACSGGGRIAISPLPIAQSTYHVQPSQSDTFTHANYISLSGSFNAIGRDLGDNAQLAQFKYHHAGKAGQFQYFGGVQVNAGAYNFDRYDDPYIDPGAYPYPTRRSNFVFSGALSAGAAFVLPVAPTFDWRIIGVEGNMGLESGRYYQYRKSVPDSAIQYVDRRRLQDMYFLTTEMVFRRRRSGAKFGYQFGVGTNFRQVPYADNYYWSSGGSGYYDDGNTTHVIVRNTFHFAKDPMAFYFQVYGGRYLLALNTGLTYRIPSRRE